MDWITIVLGVIIVLIFMAIFTLLKVMNSPYIKRFESVLHGKFQPLESFQGCFHIPFLHEGRPVELLEVQYKLAQPQKTVYNDFLFLRVKTSSRLSLRLVDVFTEGKIRFVLDDIFPPLQDKSLLILPNIHMNDLFKEFKILTSDTMLAKNFLTAPEVVETYRIFKAQLGAMGFVSPIVIHQGVVTLDYSVSERCLNELVANPRYIHKHAELLNQLALRLEA